ncbi:MAG TPA: nucleotidyl transferase AbiEii/AbiGii toxin family protein [Pseudobdellovibrionaceae bacterium]|nr:nucleotidyl transferase AbiEii/AbiGii toxin family protein [Pseudobdellovibrionaceae bacterium]
MFEREHHLRIATVLQALNADLLYANHCFFGGGTAIVLARQEYRESLDIDFMVSDRNGYLILRQLLTGDQGLNAIVRPGMNLTPTRDIRADQYGIRTMLRVAETEIKFEIVLEARTHFAEPDRDHAICGVVFLTDLDLATSKILANSDRWHDDSVFSRDLIDLAMLDLSRPSYIKALEKASQAYGESAARDLLKAIDALKTRKGRLDDCMSALKMENVPKALLWKRIRDLKRIDIDRV